MLWQVCYYTYGIGKPSHLAAFDYREDADAYVDKIIEDGDFKAGEIMVRYIHKDYVG